MSKKISLYLLLIIIFGSIFIFTDSVFAEETIEAAAPPLKQEAKAPFENPLARDGDSKEIDPNMLIGRIINGVLSIVGSLALLMFIAGGLVWMTAAGNQERVTKGKNILVWATVGLIVIFTAYALVTFIFKGLGVEST